MTVRFVIEYSDGDYESTHNVVPFEYSSTDDFMRDLTAMVKRWQKDRKGFAKKLEKQMKPYQMKVNIDQYEYYDLRDKHRRANEHTPYLIEYNGYFFHPSYVCDYQGRYCTPTVCEIESWFQNYKTTEDET